MEVEHKVNFLINHTHFQNEYDSKNEYDFWELPFFLDKKIFPLPQNVHQNEALKKNC